MFKGWPEGGLIFFTSRCQTCVKSEQRDAPLLKVFELDPSVCCLSAVFALQKRNLDKLLKRWNFRVVRREIWGGHPIVSPGPEDTLTGVGGPVRPGAFLLASFPVCLLVQLCSLQECTLHLLPAPTPYLHTEPTPPTSSPQESSLSFLGSHPYS